MFNRTTSEPLQFSLQFLSKNGWKIISLDPPGANLHVHAPPVGPLLELSLEKEVSPTLVHFPELRLSPLNTKEKCNARIVFSGNKVLLKRADFDLNVYLRGVQLVESCKLNHGDVFHLEDFPVVFRALPSTAPPIMPPIFYNGRRVAVVPLLKKRLHVGSTNQCEILSLRSPIHGCLVRFARDRHRAPFVFNILPGSGALVNGQSFREHRLQPGDQVKVAGETFTFDGLNILIHSSFPQPLETRDIFLESNGVPILGPLNLQLYPGEFVGLFSPPAAGKTLLLRCLGGEITPSSGEVRIGSIPLSSILSKHPYLIGRASIRNLPEQAITVQEAFLFHLRIRQPSHLRLPQLIEQAEKISKELQIDHLLRRRIVELSATERRLVAIAIEIASKPIYLLVDEPSAILSPEQESKLLMCLRKFADEGCGVLYASNRPEAMEICDRILLLADKDIVFSGPYEVALHNAGVNSPAELLDFLSSTESFPANSSHRHEQIPTLLEKKPVVYPNKQRFIFAKLFNWDCLPQLKSIKSLIILPLLLGFLSSHLFANEVIAENFLASLSLASVFFAYFSTCGIFASIYTYRRWRMLGIKRLTIFFSKLLSSYLVSLTQTIIFAVGCSYEIVNKLNLNIVQYFGFLQNLHVFFTITFLILITSSIAICAISFTRNTQQVFLVGMLWIGLLTLGYFQPNFAGKKLIFNLTDTLPSFYSKRILEKSGVITKIQFEDNEKFTKDRNDELYNSILSKEIEISYLNLIIWFIIAVFAANFSLRGLEKPPLLKDAV